MNDSLIKATESEAWEPIKEAIKEEIDRIKDINLILTMDEKEKNVYEMTSDPMRVGQMLAYRTLKNILTGMMRLESEKRKTPLTDYL